MNKRNKSGCMDITAYHAITNVTKQEKAAAGAKVYKPLVYVASPYAGDITHNTEQTRRYCRYAVDQGCIPLAPHLLFPQFMDEGNKQEREMGLFFALVLLGKVDELWVFGSHISKGMAQEIKKASKRGLPIKHFGEVLV